jgi:hypothetical protein
LAINTKHSIINPIKMSEFEDEYEIRDYETKMKEVSKETGYAYKTGGCISDHSTFLTFLMGTH